jgi:hypothetical protein
VTIYIPEKTRADVFRLPLDNKVKLMIAETNKWGKGNTFLLFSTRVRMKCLRQFSLLLGSRKAINWR